MSRKIPSPSPAAFVAAYANIIACIIIMIIAVCAIVVSLRFPTTPIPTDIGAGAFPKLFASLLLVLCTLLISSELIKIRRASTSHPPAAHQKEESATATSQEKGSYITPAIGVLVMVAYIGLMSTFGYLLLTFLVLVGLIKLLGFSNFLFNIVISLTITVALYLLFDVG